MKMKINFLNLGRYKWYEYIFIFIFIFILGVSRSISYILFKEDYSPRIIKYFNLSPLPIAFVHPTFFAKKEILVNYNSHSVKLDYMKNLKFFKNRVNYRTFMFMFDGFWQDRERDIQYLYCNRIDLIGFHHPPGQLPVSIEFIYYFKKPRKVKKLCQS